MHRLERIEKEWDDFCGHWFWRSVCQCGAKSSWHEAEQDAQEGHDWHMQEVTVSALRATDPGIQFVPILGDKAGLDQLRVWLSRFGLEA